MPRNRIHRDVEFQVENLFSEAEAVFDTFDEAAGFAVAAAAGKGQPVTIDVVIWSKAGARWYGGDWAVEVYEEDPEASVFERIEVKAYSKGRIA